MTFLEQIISNVLSLFKSPMTQADVAAALDKRAAEIGGPLIWRTSIVDLLKVLKMDSSLSARIQLARDLGYPGPFDGSAEMNEFLHKHVLTKIAEHGITIGD